MTPGRRAVVGLSICLMAGATDPAEAQSVLGHSPNTRPTYRLSAGQGALRIGHRFEFLGGGDELLNIPTLTLAFGLGKSLAAGLDFTSNSEIVPSQLGGNETQFWLGASLVRTSRAAVDVLAAYNTAAASADAGLTGRLTIGGLGLLAEMRGFSDALAGGSAGTAGTIGASLRLSPFLELAGDLGRMLSTDTLGTVWSAGIAMAIPGSPHTLSLTATNGGATTLQGVSRRKVLGTESVRYGFVFTLPLGSGRQWSRIFRRGDPAESTTPGGADAVVAIRQVALQPVETRIRVGQSVAWVNDDPVVHTVTAEDRSWDSGELAAGASFVRRFDRPGRYRYHCLPHPQMRGVIVVE